MKLCGRISILVATWRLCQTHFDDVNLFATPPDLNYVDAEHNAQLSLEENADMQEDKCVLCIPTPLPPDPLPSPRPLPIPTPLPSTPPLDSADPGPTLYTDPPSPLPPGEAIRTVCS